MTRLTEEKVEATRRAVLAAALAVVLAATVLVASPAAADHFPDNSFDDWGDITAQSSWRQRDWTIPSATGQCGEFVLTEWRTVQLRATQPDFDAGLILYDHFFSDEFAKSDRAGNVREKINRLLRPGNYLACVSATNTGRDGNVRLRWRTVDPRREREQLAELSADTYGAVNWDGRLYHPMHAQVRPVDFSNTTNVYDGNEVDGIPSAAIAVTVRFNPDTPMYVMMHEGTATARGRSLGVGLGVATPVLCARNTWYPGCEADGNGNRPRSTGSVTLYKRKKSDTHDLAATGFSIEVRRYDTRPTDTNTAAYTARISICHTCG